MSPWVPMFPNQNLAHSNLWIVDPKLLQIPLLMGSWFSSGRFGLSFGFCSCVCSINRFNQWKSWGAEVAFSAVLQIQRCNVHVFLVFLFVWFWFLFVCCFTPGKYKLLQKMLPTKQLFIKLAHKYHLPNVTGHLQMLNAMCAFPKMKLQLAGGELL